jgi:hypothetical protein
MGIGAEASLQFPLHDVPESEEISLLSTHHPKIEALGRS